MKNIRDTLKQLVETFCLYREKNASREQGTEISTEMNGLKVPLHSVGCLILADVGSSSGRGRTYMCLLCRGQSSSWQMKAMPGTERKGYM